MGFNSAFKGLIMNKGKTKKLYAALPENTEFFISNLIHANTTPEYFTTVYYNFPTMFQSFHSLSSGRYKYMNGRFCYRKGLPIDNQPDKIH